MDSGYILEAKRDPARPDTLTLHYPSREYALSAAAIIQSQGSIVTVIGPDGALIFDTGTVCPVRHLDRIAAAANIQT